MAKTYRFLAVGLVATIVAAGCGRPAAEPAAQPAPTVAATVPPPPPPHAIYALQWVSHEVPATFTRGVAVPVQVTVKNTGDWTWPDPPTSVPAMPSNGSYAVRLGYAWVTPDGKSAYGEKRAELPGPVPPGETVTLTLDVSPPADPGDYKLQLDLVQELVAWFGAQGAETLLVPVRVD